MTMPSARSYTVFFSTSMRHADRGYDCEACRDTGGKVYLFADRQAPDWPPQPPWTGALGLVISVKSVPRNSQAILPDYMEIKTNHTWDQAKT
jgi:hypothetical protein